MTLIFIFMEDGQIQQQFLLVNDGDEDKILMFATINNLTNSSRNHLCYTSPSQPSQLHTLRVEVNGAMYPLVFGLLPEKSE